MFGGSGGNGLGESVVSAAREAREERAASRRKEAAAVKLQTALRGLIARKNFRKLIR